MAKKKTRLKMRGLKWRLLTIPPMIVVVLLASVVTALGTAFAPTVGAFLGNGTQTVNEPEGTEGWDTSYYDEQYSSSDEAKDAAYDVADEVLQEGTVLLKDDGVLPLAKGSTVSPFGYAAINPVYGQVSSGGSAKWSVDPVNAQDGLGKAYTVDTSAIDAMTAAGDPEPLKEAPGTTEAGKAGSMLGGNSFIYEYDPSVYDGLRDLSDTTGVVFISRAGQEGSDMKYDAYSDGTPHYLALSENEKQTIKVAKEKCARVVVVLVASQPMEVAPLMSGEYEADAIVWVGQPGELGFSELASIMDGDVNPSGRTVDTWATDFTADPSYQNIGSFSYDNVTTSSASLGGQAGEFNRYYTDYQEGVYIGYRYYETADVMDDAFTYGTLDGKGATATTGAVTYPFGYGLSYTSFSQQIVGYDDAGDDINVQVAVTNTGDTYAGKDVVQLYYGAPYTQLDIDDKVEKPVANLIAFDKTELLAPGESQTLTLSFSKEDMASYCYTHANPDGTTGCYLLESGDYQISLRSDSHDVIDTRTTTIPDTVWYDGSDDAHIRTSDRDAQSELDDAGNATDQAMTGTYVAATNEFQTSSDYMNEESTILSRADWEGTKPQTVANRTKSLDQKYADQLGQDTTFDVATDPTYGDVEGSLVYESEQPTSGATNGLTLASMRGVAYDDPKWDAFLDQIDWSGDKDGILRDFAGASYALGSVSSLGIPETKIEDGANGLKVESGMQNSYDMSKSSSFPFGPVMASTWNTELLYRVGAAFGQEALANGITGWYCPAVNLHRSPFSGRVFEYYSEDPVLSGALATQAISGAGDQGLYVTLKHFALNDTETNRSNLASVWADEQTMRELYFKPFEMAVKDSHMTVKYTADETGATTTKVMRATTGIMPSQAGVGTRLGTVNPNLLQNVLRGEWGFRGTVYTDYWVWGDNNFRDLCLRTGSDAYLCMYMPFMWNLNDYDSATARWAMRNSIHDIAYTLANSNATQGAAPGATYTTSMPGWRIGAIAATVVLWALVGLYIWRLVARARDEKRHPEKYKPRRSRKAAVVEE